MKCCKNCLDPQETPDGIIDLDEEGLCDSCREHREKMEILSEDMKQSMDFDYGMNF